MRINRRSLAIAALIAVPATAFVARQAMAWPNESPSARAAARLKYHPPKNWIRHYLGDDRYKIAGGVWNVVSTQTDTYYHRATCPNMLRQSADIVIGFNKSSEAEEAGYRADPTCQPGITAVIYEASAVTRSTTSGAVQVPTVFVNRGRTAQRIVLADGVSTVLLPPNWRRSRIEAKVTAGQRGELREQADLLQSTRGRGHIVFAFSTYPAGTNAQQLVDFVAALMASLSKLPDRPSGRVDNSMDELRKIKTTPATLGGLRGISFRAPGMKIVTQGGTVQVSRGIAAARANKIYFMADSSGFSDARGARTIQSSFQPR